MPTFDPKLSEYIARGETAALLLDAMRLLVGECVEQTINRLMNLVVDGSMTPELAMGFCYEITAYKKLIQRQLNKIEQGRAAAIRAQESPQ